MEIVGTLYQLDAHSPAAGNVVTLDVAPICFEGKPDVRLVSDEFGTKWVLKFHGENLAWREIVFGRLARAVGLRCMEAGLIEVDPGQLAQVIGVNVFSNVHLAAPYIQSHGKIADCGPTCPIRRINGISTNTEADLDIYLDSGVVNIADTVAGEILGILCGALEAGECIYTPEHFVVLIDSERAFSSPPGNLIDLSYHWFPRTMAIGQTLCERLVSLTPANLDEIVAMPARWDSKCVDGIREKLRLAQEEGKFALEWLTN